MSHEGDQFEADVEHFIQAILATVKTELGWDDDTEIEVESVQLLAEVFSQMAQNLNDLARDLGGELPN